MRAAAVIRQSPVWSRRVLILLTLLILLALPACGSGEERPQAALAVNAWPAATGFPIQTPAAVNGAQASSMLLPTPTLRPELEAQIAEDDGGRAGPPVSSPVLESSDLPLLVDDETALAAIRVPPAAARPDAVMVPCSERVPNSALSTVVTQTYGVSKAFAPEDLVPLSDYLPYDVTVGYPTDVRRVIIEPLVRMIGDMRAAGLHPQILSGYRSFAAQAIAWDKWNRLYPERAAIISARPGHSEHQLGTVIDFGSPELTGLVGQPDILFHTYFVKTSEGQWLAEHAHEYGFTLSYTLEAFETTGFYYEPWHYRYVGEEMAALLREEGQTLTEYQLAHHPPPCLP